MARNVVFDLNFKPHDGQMEVLQGIASAPEAGIITIDASRGWGKTLFTVASLVIPHCLSRKNAQVMWVAPTYKICRSPVDDVFNGIDEETGERFIPQFCPETNFQFWEYYKADMEIHWFNDAKIFFRSADNPDSIVSKGYSLIIIDEAALIGEEVFTKQILATARRQGCKIIIISTPRGKNWFYQKYIDGQDPSKNMYVSFNQPWWKRPDYPALLVELMKTLPEHIRAQEFEAKFIDNAGGTFANIHNIFKGPEIKFPNDTQEWEDKPDEDELEKSIYVVSADIAKSMDYTVIVAMNMQTKKIHYYKRFNKTDYKTVCEIIEKTAERYNDADIIFDATGVGKGIQDILTSNAHPFVFTNDSKNEIVNKLIMAFDYETIGIPNIFTVKQEFELFEYSITRTGKISYSAPAGRHDDCVMSIAMANWYAEENAGMSEVESIDNFLEVVDEDGPRNFYEFMEQDND